MSIVALLARKPPLESIVALLARKPPLESIVALLALKPPRLWSRFSFAMAGTSPLS